MGSRCKKGFEIVSRGKKTRFWERRCETGSNTGAAECIVRRHSGGNDSNRMSTWVSRVALGKVEHPSAIFAH